jgi:hypothetical protein
MMWITRKVKVVCLLLIAFSLEVLPAYAQGTYKYKADIRKIDSSGVYKIELKYDLIAKSLENLSDIRLLDNNGKFVAYALSNHLSRENHESFIEFSEVNSNNLPDTATFYIAENKSRLNIRQLWIRLKNTAVNRSVNLSGSENLKEWFAIKEDIQLEGADSEKGPDYEQVLNFPTSNYHYLRIQVNGKNKTPVKILRSGIYVTNDYRPEFAALPLVKFNQKDGSKVSHIFIHFDEAYMVNKLNLEIAAPKYYSRRIVVNDIKNKSIDQICDTILNSSGSQSIILSAKTNSIRIDIYNGDDNALRVKAISAYQLRQFAISYLEGDNSYYILTGDSSAKGVKYDLVFLKYRSYNQLHLISHSAIYKNTAFAIPKAQTKHNFTLFLWIVIVVVLILLSFLTWKMVREINERQVK